MNRHSNQSRATTKLSSRTKRTKQPLWVMSRIGWLWLVLTHCAGSPMEDGDMASEQVIDPKQVSTAEETQGQNQATPSNTTGQLPGNATAPNPNTPITPVPNQPPPPPPQPQGDTFSNYIDAQMELHCRGCHVASFLTADSVQLPSRRVLQRIETGNMPPARSPPIPAADKARIRAWFDAGGPA